MNECGEWDRVKRQCHCICVGASVGIDAGVDVGDSSNKFRQFELAVGVVAGKVSGWGKGAGLAASAWLKWGAKYCWCDCDKIQKY